MRTRCETRFCWLRFDISVGLVEKGNIDEAVLFHWTQNYHIWDNKIAFSNYCHTLYSILSIAPSPNYLPHFCLPLPHGKLLPWSESSNRCCCYSILPSSRSTASLSAPCYLLCHSLSGISLPRCKKDAASIFFGDGKRRANNRLLQVRSKSLQE